MSTRMDALERELEPLRQRLARHDLYRHIRSLGEVHIFMQHHGFAVWDFMSLLKTLQRHLTCVTIPWIPKGDGLSRRFINELVLGEESDEDGNGGYMSHFELYLAAMVQCGANTTALCSFLDLLAGGAEVSDALDRAHAPRAASSFVRATWEIILSEPVHVVAAVFLLGREWMIPDMFRGLIRELEARSPANVSLLSYYLNRHVQVDEGNHAPMARRMLETLCGDDPTRWEECTQVAQKTLCARIALWDGILDEISGAGVMDTSLAGIHLHSLHVAASSLSLTEAAFSSSNRAE